MKSILIFFLFSLNIHLELNSQNIYRINTLPVYHGSKKLINPFTGGMNACIINQMDLNNDGKKDLVTIHNYSYKISTYLNLGNDEYKYTPKYETFFPKKQSALFILADMNEDNLEDLILFYQTYFILYINTRIDTNTFQFQIADTLKAYSYDTISKKFPIVMNSINGVLPIIRDLDGDGDQDIVYKERGNNNVHFHYRNYKKEKGLPANQNKFYIDNLYWGQHAYGLNPLVIQSNYFKRIIQGLPPKNELQPRHDDYQMLWDLDINRDGKYEGAAYSENQIYAPLGLNIGTKDSAHIVHYDTFFPSYNKPIKAFMPIGFWLDVNHDSNRDILTSFLLERDGLEPVQAKAFNDDVQTISFYKNLGPKKIADTKFNSGFHDSFQFISDSFLADQTIDVGTGSAPIFYNYDHDSLVDMLVPNIMKRDSWELGSIAYYRNEGTKTLPEFKLVDKNLFNFKSKNRTNIRMATGDLNGDTIPDLMISSVDRSEGVFPFNYAARTYYEIYYQKHSNGNVIYLLDTLNIDFSENLGRSQPFLYDVDKDGKLDLFMGSYHYLKYYRNLGTKTKADFSKVTHDSVLSVYSIYPDFDLNRIPFYFYPAIWHDKKDSQDYLIFAYHYESGKIGKAIIDTQKLNNQIPLTIVSKDLYNLSINQNPTLFIQDITNDKIPELAIGNYAGGVQLFSFDSLTGEAIYKEESSLEKEMNDFSLLDSKIYPNPSSDKLNIDLPVIDKIELDIYSIEGKLVQVHKLNPGLNQILIDYLFKGIYHLKLTNTKTLENHHIQFIKN